MINNSHQNAVQIASSNENTPELANYWQSRYSTLLEKDLFRISTKTLELLNMAEVTKPATTFGDLVLVQHLGENGELDEAALQTTIETAVRFLDSLLDKLNFNTSAKSIVEQYRKIGLGVADFKEYLGKRSNASELDEVDYLGNLISSAAYRASESLAEEKGACLSWDKIKKHLRPKSFEYWFDIETGEVKNGLEMNEDYDEDTILISKFEIVPRRNVALLLLPPDLEWQIWSDRDDTAPKTEIVIINQAEAEKPEIELPTTQPARIEDTNLITEEKPVISLLDQIKSDEVLDFTQSIEQPKAAEPIPEAIFIEEDKADEQPIIFNSEEKEDEDLESKNQEMASIRARILPEDDIKLIEAEPLDKLTFDNKVTGLLDLDEQELLETESDKNELLEKPEEKLMLVPETADLKIETNTDEEESQTSTDINIENENPPKLNFVELNQNFMFQIGELVQLPKENNKVYQVLDSKHEDGINKYELSDGKNDDMDVFIAEDQIQTVELFEILEKINLQANSINTQTSDNQEVVIENSGWELWASALIFKGDNILTIKEENVDYLPSVKINFGENPEKALIYYLEQKYNLHGRVVEEVGSFVKDSKANITFQIQIKEQELPTGLFESKIGTLQEIGNPYRLIINKFNRRQLYWQNQIEKAIKNSVPAQPEVISSDNSSPATEKEVSTFTKITPEFNPILNTMTKYSLKLEQIVQTKVFGDIVVTIQYDSEGPKIIVATGKSLNPELKHLLDTVLLLVNFTLTKKISPVEIANQLEIQPEDGMQLPLNDLLTIIAETLKTAPVSADQINNSLIV
jgi:hypothetical protein